jgi:hypothetical protein
LSLRITVEKVDDHAVASQFAIVLDAVRVVVVPDEVADRPCLRILVAKVNVVTVCVPGRRLAIL